MERWFSASVAACWEIATPPRMPFKPPSLCSHARHPQSHDENSWQAGSMAWPGGPRWTHCARAARQYAREKRLGIISPVQRMDEIQKSELRAILDEELAGLPERHRAAILLCELEGLSRRDAAARLGVSEGTLSSRLARAKLRLRDRLTRRGLALSAASLASALAQDAEAVCVPRSLVDSAIRGATLVASGSSLAEVASTSVITLTEGILKAMLLSKLKFAVLGLVTVAMVTAGAGVVAQDRPSDEDRLKNLERKLDRVLEGSEARTDVRPGQTLRRNQRQRAPRPSPHRLPPRAGAGRSPDDRCRAPAANAAPRGSGATGHSVPTAGAACRRSGSSQSRYAPSSSPPGTLRRVQFTGESCRRT